MFQYHKLENKTYHFKNFLNNEEVALIRNDIEQNFKQNSAENLYQPYRYPDIDWANIEGLNQKSSLFKQQFSLNIQKIVAERASSFFAEQNFIALNDLVDNGLKFNPYTLRILQPENVDIHHHVENQAIANYPRFFEALGKWIEVMDQFSFVLMIQQAEQGGEIILFKDRWENQEKVEDQRVRLDELDKAGEIQPEIQEAIGLGDGDLLIFPAGITWHKVAEVYGAKPRITIGGFMGRLHSDQKYYAFWS